MVRVGLDADLLREQQVLQINQATYTVSSSDHLLDLVFQTTPCIVTLPNSLGTRTRFRLVQEGSATVSVAQPFAAGISPHQPSRRRLLPQATGRRWRSR